MFKTILILTFTFFIQITHAEILQHKSKPVKKKQSKVVKVREKSKTKKANINFKKPLTLNVKKKAKIKLSTFVSKNIHNYLTAMIPPLKKISQLNPPILHGVHIDAGLPIIFDRLETYRREIYWNLDTIIEESKCSKNCKKYKVDISQLEVNKNELLSLIDDVSDKILLADDTYGLLIEQEKIGMLRQEYDWIVEFERTLHLIRNTHFEKDCRSSTEFCKKYLVINYI